MRDVAITKKIIITNDIENLEILENTPLTEELNPLISTHSTLNNEQTPREPSVPNNIREQEQPTQAIARPNSEEGEGDTSVNEPYNITETSILGDLSIGGSPASTPCRVRPHKNDSPVSVTKSQVIEIQEALRDMNTMGQSNHNNQLHPDHSNQQVKAIRPTRNTRMPKRFSPYLLGKKQKY